MKRLRFLYILLLSFSTFVQGLPQSRPSGKVLPNDFNSHVFTHITHLAEMGHRQVGTDNDKRTIQYIKDQLKKLGIDVEIQRFDFESFEYTDTHFQIGDQQLNVIGLGFNPYEKKKEYEGKPILIDLNESEIPFSQQDIEGKVIFNNNWNGHFILLRYKPELMIGIKISQKLPKIILIKSKRG